MNKKYTLNTLMITMLLSSGVHLSAEKVALTSRFLQIIDGSFLTGEIVGLTLQVRKKLIEMAEGKRQPDGTHEGTYTFNQVAHCIHQLADCETTLVKALEDAELKRQAACTESEKEAAGNELETIENKINELNVILKTAKNDFQEAVNVFMSRVRSVKEPVIMLINEYCEKANRPESLLLDWSKIQGEDEDESFNNQVTNFNIFYAFIYDLANFMEALVRGCPKAQQQFKKLMLEKTK